MIGARVAALEEGADGYISSPVEPAVLVATVRSLLRLRTAEQAVHDAALEWQATFDAIRDGVALLDAQGSGPALECRVARAARPERGRNRRPQPGRADTAGRRRSAASSGDSRASAARSGASPRRTHLQHHDRSDGGFRGQSCAARWPSSRTSPSANGWTSSCGIRRSWRASACWRAASRTISIIC